MPTPEQPKHLPETSPEGEGRGEVLKKLDLFNEDKPKNLPGWLTGKPSDPNSTQLISGIESTDDDGDEDEDDDDDHDNQETDDSDEDEIEGGTTRRF